MSEKILERYARRRWSALGGAMGCDAAAEGLWLRALPLFLAGAIGIMTGGLVAAAVAHAPTQPSVWLVAYLVLVVGVVQITLAAGQVVIAGFAASAGVVWLECALFNLGSVGVMAGTLGDAFLLVALGTVLVLGALMVFLHAVQHTPVKHSMRAYQGFIALVAIGACVGMVLSALRTGH